MNEDLSDLCRYEKNAEEFQDAQIDDKFSSDHDVSIVKDTKTNKMLVKKSFYLNDDVEIKYFDREVKLLNEVKIKGFPFIKFFGFHRQKIENEAEDDDESFILTEYLSNGSFNQLIEKKFSPDSHIDNYDTILMKILYGIAFGLNYLHNHKSIVHRDIKPDNIFLDDDFNPYIGDFGFSRIIKKDEVKMTGSTGSLLYMAPEIMYEEVVNKDMSIDSYSFAITVLKALTGSLTIYDENNNETSADCVEEDYLINYFLDGNRYNEIEKLNEDLSAFREFITACWDENPDKRWKIDKILKSMKNKELYLPNCNDEVFSQYVDKLDDFLIKHQQHKKPLKKKKSTKKFRPSISKVDDE